MAGQGGVSDLFLGGLSMESYGRLFREFGNCSKRLSMTKSNFKKRLRCEEFPGHFQQFLMTVLSKVSSSSRMAARELSYCVQRTMLFLVFSILRYQNYLYLKLYPFNTLSVLCFWQASVIYSFFLKKLGFYKTLDKTDTDARKFCRRVIKWE